MRIDYKYVTFFASLVILNVVGMENDQSSNSQKTRSFKELNEKYQLYKVGVVHVPNSKLNCLDGIAELNFGEPGFQHYIKLLDASDNQLTNLPEGFTQLNDLKELYLNDNKLTKLLHLSSCTKLERLEIDNNQIESFINDDKSKFLFTSLIVLSCNNNKLTNLPESISLFTQLCQLYAKNNSITNLPSNFTSLRFLRSLDLSFNKLQELPDSFAEVRKNVTQIVTSFHYNFSHNLLTKLPDNIGTIQEQEMHPFHLSFQSNALTHLPISLGKLHRLLTINLSNNRLTKIPDEIGNCTELRTLTLNNNKLDKLPESITKLINLQDLQLMDNPNLKTKVPKTLYTFLCALDEKGALHCGNPIARQEIIPAEIRRTIYEYVS